MKIALDTVKNRHDRELKQMAKIQEVLTTIFTSYGCRMVETPIFEPYDTYSKYFPHLRKEFIKSIDIDGGILVLRPDVTIPLVKSLAIENEDSRAYLKFAYISNVFLNYQGRHGGGKDFMQGGAEILGSAETDCDSEIVYMAIKILRALDINNLHVDLGTVAYSNAFYEELSLPPRDISKLQEAVEERNMDKIEELCHSLQIKEEKRRFLFALPTLFGSYDETMERAKSLCRNRAMVRALERLEEIANQLRWEEREHIFHLDFAFSNRLNYYTDMIFKIYAEGAPYSLVDGGRYDTMSAEFGVDRPACGFGININLLHEYIRENHLMSYGMETFSLLLRYTNIDRDFLELLGQVRNKGIQVVAAPTYGVVDEDEFSLVGSYSKGLYSIKSTSYSKEELIEYLIKEMK